MVAMCDLLLVWWCRGRFGCDLDGHRQDGAGADAPVRAAAQRRTVGDGLSCLERNVEGRSPQAGEESRQGPLRSRRQRRSRSPSRLAHQRTHPERPDRTRAGRNCTSPPRRPPPQQTAAPGTNAASSPHPDPPPSAPGPTTTGPLDHARAGRTLRSRLPAWTDRCAIDSTRERALSAKRPTTSARHIRGGRVEAARTAASTRAGPPTPRRFAVRAGTR